MVQFEHEFVWMLTEYHQEKNFFFFYVVNSCIIDLTVYIERKLYPSVETSKTFFSFGSTKRSNIFIKVLWRLSRLGPSRKKVLSETTQHQILIISVHHNQQKYVDIYQ